MKDGKIRFTDRVVEFQKYRPSYPDAVIDLIGEQFAATQHVPVADVGAGTGIFTRQLLTAGYDVFAVEPNHAMRKAAENQLADFQFAQCLPGSAEETGIPDLQVDLVTVAQAFHWFDLDSSRTEFMRITRPPHRVALVWNYRYSHLSPFNQVYEEFLQRWCDDYAGIRDVYLDEGRIEQFFNSGHFSQHTFENQQSLNWSSLQGRVKSSSFAPAEMDPRFIPMNCELRQLFDQQESEGRVVLRYETKVFIGEMKASS